VYRIDCDLRAVFMLSWWQNEIQFNTV